MIKVNQLQPGDPVSVIERECESEYDELGDPIDVSSYMFIAIVGEYVIATPWIDDFDTPEETLSYFAKQTAVESSSDLVVIPIADCYASYEEATANLVQGG